MTYREVDPRTPQERLERVAQELDEMSEETPELLALSEELTDIAKFWPTERPVQRDRDNPRWLEDIRSLVERAAGDILFARYGTPPDGRLTIQAPGRLTIQAPINYAPSQQHLQYPSPTLPPSELAKITGI